ncbi:class I SAM-dependent methyltransferase [Shouchella tritolerans]|uniref:class I SAM-dependent methyltransferase n=1 Tax=Shouchella tritolerans TaxID=2979466 RepID=UPI0021E70AC4|nr:class I SAM-dependent methyltransferase [Shouchella tritolerans]
MDFHDKRNQNSYSGRNTDSRWLTTIASHLSRKHIDIAADIGCGGGIYTRALAMIGIPHVIGVDSSAQMLADAKKACREFQQIELRKGDCEDLPLASESTDLLLARALIHHLPSVQPFFQEAARTLTSGGLFIIQNRTLDDCFLPGSTEHVRGYFFSAFPRLRKIEAKRRFSSAYVRQALHSNGFLLLHEETLWETRAIHPSKQELLVDLSKRKGRSILHQLSDQELAKLVHVIDTSLEQDGPIVEKDRWTLWIAEKQAER